MITDEAANKAMRYCTCCHEPRRLHVQGVWVCTKCDGDWPGQRWWAVKR